MYTESKWGPPDHSFVIRDQQLLGRCFVWYRKQIKRIMERFDFARVHRAMSALQWTWSMSASGVPSVYELRQEARRLLESVAESKKKRSSLSCGGLLAEKVKKSLRLSFEITEWSGDD